jgi:hypothetical protein
MCWCFLFFFHLKCFFSTGSDVRDLCVQEKWFKDDIKLLKNLYIINLNTTLYHMFKIYVLFFLFHLWVEIEITTHKKKILMPCNVLYENFQSLADENLLTRMWKAMATMTGGIKKSCIFEKGDKFGREKIIFKKFNKSVRINFITEFVLTLNFFS